MLAFPQLTRAIARSSQETRTCGDRDRRRRTQPRVLRI